MDIYSVRTAESLAGERINTRSDAKRTPSRTRHKRGQAAVEFAIVVPLLLTLLVGVEVFGVAFFNDSALTFATNNAAQLLSISRGQTTDPCSTTSQAVYSAAPQLTQSNVKFTIVLNGTSVTSGTANPTCSGSQQYLVASQKAAVTATYPCNLK